MATEQELAQALGPAFGIYPKAFRGNTGNPQDAANLPVNVMRGRTAGLLGLPSDLLNMFQSPKPMEVFGDVQYEPKIKVPYDTEHFLKTLPLAPTSRAGQVAGQAASFVPLNPAPLVRAGVAGAKALAPTAARMTEGYLQRQGLMPGVMPEQPSLLGNITTKPKAEVSPLGFYSAVEQQALNIPRKQGSGESFLNDLAKGQDVKKYEMETMGLDEFLRGKPNVTRQEVQDFIAGNRINVQEKQLGAAVSEDPVGIAQRKAVFDKYEPQIQAMYKDIDQYETNIINARNLASKNETEAIAALNREGNPQPIPTTEDWDRYFVAKAESERVNKIPLDSRESVRKLDALVNARDVEANAVYTVPESTPTKYERYQLPGGENYREILLTLPRAKSEVFTEIQQKIKRLEAMKEIQAEFAAAGNIERANSFATKANALEESIKELKHTPIPKPREDYKSSHFDEPNILAHMRVNDRIDADGKKMLLIEEVQSDWHQAGREKGYGPKMEKSVEAYYETKDGQRIPIGFGKTKEEAEAAIDVGWKNQVDIKYETTERQIGEGVPDAPFKDTWHQLALKRALKEAVDKGYDRIGLTTGKQQAERYDLSKQISKVYYSPPDSKQANKYGTVFKAFDSRGNEIINKSVTPEELPGIVGKEVAQKLLDAESNSMGVKALEGVDLQVGGEGMKKYYDEIYPAFLNKQGKKYGAQVGEVEIGLPPKTSNSWAYFRDWFAENHGNVGSSNTALSNWEQGANNKYVKEFEKFRKAATQTEKVRYLDITPEMRKAIKEGQPIASIQNELAKALA